MSRTTGLVVLTLGVLSIAAVSLGVYLFQRNQTLSLELQTARQAALQRARNSRPQPTPLPPEGRPGRQWGSDQPPAEAGPPPAGQALARRVQDLLRAREEAGEDVAELRETARHAQQLFRDGREDQARRLLAQIMPPDRDGRRSQGGDKQAGGKQGNNRQGATKQGAPQQNAKNQSGTARAAAGTPNHRRQSGVQPGGRRPTGLQFNGGRPGAVPPPLPVGPVGWQPRGEGPGQGRSTRPELARRPEYRIENDRVAVRLNPANASLSLYDKLLKRTWQQEVPDHPFTLARPSRQGDRLTGELQTAVPCRLEVGFGQAPGDVVVTLRPQDVFNPEENRQVVLAYPYPLAAAADVRPVVPWREPPADDGAGLKAGTWLSPEAELAAPWFGLTCKSGAVVCLFSTAERWSLALQVTDAKEPRLCPTWRNKDGAVQGALTVIYHLTSVTAPVKLQEAFEASLAVGVEREQ